MAHKTYQYCVAENWGKGFITHADSRRLSILSFPGDVWRVPAHNQDANRWIAGVAGTRKTLSEAQAIVDAVITQAQSDWDAIPEDDERKTVGHPMYESRPADITFEE